MKPDIFSFEAIGTQWKIELLDERTPVSKEIIEKAIHARIDAYDKAYSRFRSDSLVTRMSEHAGDYALPEDAQELFSLYQKLYQVTNGFVTPLIGSLLEQSGYDASYSLTAKEITKPFTWEEALVYDYPMLTIKKPVLLDFGAAGKGYLVDIIAKLVESYGVQSYCVDGGGDIAYKATEEKTLRVGLEHPENFKQVIGIAEIKNESICGSAGNRRKWGDFHHIIDPKTLRSPQHIRAVWVISKKTSIADGLTTCLFFVPPEKLLEYFSFEYVIVYEDYRIQKSEMFPGEFFYEHTKMNL